MKSYERLFIFGLFVLALTALLSPWAAAAWARFTSANPGYEQYSFSKIFDRVFMVMGVATFFLFRRLLKLGSLKELGLSPRTHALRDVLVGAGLALASILALTLFMSLTDVFDPFIRRSVAETLARCGKALLAAVGAAFVEEVFFRGIVFKGLRQDIKPAYAYLLASFFFAAIHFVQPSNDVALSTIEPGAGLRHVLLSFHPFFNPETILPGLFGLFLIGIVLCYAYERTGTLYLSMGLHGGWIFGLKSFGAFGYYTREDLGWMFGSTDPKVVSGVIPWIGIVIVGVLVHWITRERNIVSPLGLPGTLENVSQTDVQPSRTGE